MPSQTLDLLIQLKNDTAAGFTAMQTQLKKTQDGIDALSSASKANVGASDAMAGGQNKVRDALTSSTASATQLASVLSGDLRTATAEAAFASYNHTDALDSSIKKLAESQSAMDKYKQALRDVNQDVTMTATNLRVNFNDALAQATAELLNENRVLPETAARLHETEVALAEYTAAQKEANLYTVAGANAAADAMERETAAAIKEAEGVSAKAQSVITSVAKEAAAVSAANKKEADSLDLTSAASLRTQRALLRAGGSAVGVGQSFALAGVGLTGWVALLGGAAVYEAAKFENSMNALRNNSGATTAQMKIMQAAILDFGAKGPASLEDLAVGMRHISDLGYRGRDSVTVMRQAWEAAIATNSKAADVSNALATVLGNQHEPAAQAAKDMDEIVVAAQQGNLTIQDFATHYARVGTIMGSAHQPLADGAALLATISRATGDPSVAQTYAQNMLMHIINPTKAATVEMESLRKATGIDLAQAFSQFAQGQIRINDVLALSRTALQGNVGDTEKLFGGLRGGQGALIATINHWQDYNQITGKVNNANKVVQDGFDRMSQTTEFKLGTLKNDAIEVGIAFGTQLLPHVNDSVDTLTTDIPAAVVVAQQSFHSLEKTVDDLSYKLRHIPVPKISVPGLPGAGGGTANPLGDVWSFLGIKNPGDLAIGAAKTTAYGKAALDLKEYLDKAAKSQSDYNTAVKAWGNGVDDATVKQRLATQALNAEGTALDAVKDKQEAHTRAIRENNKELLFGLGLLGDINKAPEYKNLLGSGKVQEAPNQFQPILDLQAAIAAATKKQTDAVNQAYTDQQNLGHVTAAHEAALKAANSRLLELQNELTNFTSTAKNDVAQLNAPFLLAARNAEALGKGMASALATIKASEASALAAAKDLRSGVISSTKSDMASLTRSVPNDAVPYLAGTPNPALYTNSRPYGGTPQFDPVLQDHGTYKNAEALSPDDRAAMAKLSNSIDQLPPQFQGSFNSVVTGLQQKEKDNYNHYIDQVNKENTRDAAARTKILTDHEATVAKANAKEQSDLQKENDRYLHQLDDQETKHNQDLADHLASFNVGFQSNLATFQANMLADQEKADSQRQTHNDALTSDYGALQERLSGIHGKNADQQRQQAWDAYNRQVKHDDDTYQRQVTHDDQHVKAQAKAFTDHIKGLKDVLDGANTRSDNTLKGQEKKDKSTHDTLVNGIITARNTTITQADITEYNSQRAETGKHTANLATDKTRYDAAGNKVVDSAGKKITPEAIVSTISGGKDSAYNTAYAQVTLDIIEHGKATQKDILALQNAADGRTKIQSAQDKATALATKNVYDFALAVQNTATAITNEKNTAAGYLIHPDQGNLLVPLTPGQRAANKRSQADSGINVATPETQSQSNWDQLLKNEKDKNAQDAANLEIDKRLAVATGDWATAAADAKTQMEKGTISVEDYVKIQKQANDQQDQLNQKYILADQELGDFISAAALSKEAFLKGSESIEKYAADQQQADEQQRQQNDRQIEYDQRVGNTSEALSLITDEYHKGQRSLGELTSAYNDNQAAVAKTTAQDEAFYMATGQFGQALSSLTTQIGQGVTDSQAKVTLDVYTGNTQAIDADTKSAIAHRQAQEALTNATWDSTYATANAATQSQMRQSLASPMVSQQSTVQGLASGVFNAQLGVIAARSAVMVSEMQAEVTATNDLAGIVQAQSAVAKAQGDKQLAAVNDSIPIMNDQHAILVDLKNGNTLQLQIDRQQLLIDRTTAQMDQVVGQMQVTIALDGLKAAQDKMMVDQMNASAAYVVAVDNLTLAQDAVTLAEAEQQLGIDQLTVLNNIDTTLGSVTDYLNLIDSDLQNLQAAQDQQQSDQLQLANDTADQNYTNMAGQGILAGDTLGQAGDQAALQQQQQAYELQIAQYKVQLNAFQLQQQDSQTNGQSVAALQAMVKTLQAMLTTAHSPAGRAIQAAGVGANSWAALQSGWNSTQIPMGFS